MFLHERGQLRLVRYLQGRLVESLHHHNADLLTQIDRIWSEPDRAAAATTTSIERLEADLTEARTAIQPERIRADSVQDELAAARLGPGRPRAS
ncbi:hypothetical protein [Nocardia neocaledoniensis]|uniref:hypothetical protein n=1 Tax=Nocardia neocaledoniensis TaxID=236511 RepID=UPI002456DD4B|nr:hypothetical protein [Nocardia neocaledoniensis]